MANQRKAQRKAVTAPYQGYIPVYLNDQMKTAIKKSPGSPEGYLLKLERWAEDDYRFSLNWDATNECFVASLYDTNSARSSGGFILAARHAEARIAFDTLVYLHETVYADGWDTENTSAYKDTQW